MVQVKADFRDPPADAHWVAGTTEEIQAPDPQSLL